MQDPVHCAGAHVNMLPLASGVTSHKSAVATFGALTLAEKHALDDLVGPVRQ